MMQAMAAPVGLYAHVRSNHVRSLALFAGFLVAFHVMAAAALIGPLLLFDRAHVPFLGAGGYTLRYFLPLTLAGALLFAARYWWHVSAVHKETGFRYVDAGDEPRLVRLIEPLIIAAGLRPPFLGMIDSPALNAFALGIRDSHVVVVVTRGLVDGLDDEELEAVLAHELMHIRYRDTRLMAAANAFIANLGWLHRIGMDGRKLEDPRTALGLILLPIFLPLTLLVNFLGQLAFRVGYFSRAAIGSAREFIADAEAVRLTQNPAALASALRKVDGNDRIAGFADSHDAMLIAGAVEGPAATHPTVEQRIAALIQTTGPAMAYAPLRRDTRAFGQRGHAAGGDFLPAQAAPRPTLWQIFRQTRDPERNILGLNSKSTLVVLASGGAFLLWSHFAFQTTQLGLKDLSSLGDVTRNLAQCELQAVGKLAGLSEGPKECAAHLDSQLGAFTQRLGLPDVEAKQRAEAAALSQRQRANRCFPYSLHVWSAQHRANAAPSTPLSAYARFAAKPIPGIDAPLDGTSKAEALIDYIDMRLIIADNVPYYFGEDGRKAMLGWFEAPRHRAVIADLQQALRQPAFLAHFRTHASHADSARLLAEMPDAVPCDMKIADGTYVRS